MTRDTTGQGPDAPSGANGTGNSAKGNAAKGNSSTSSFATEDSATGNITASVTTGGGALTGASGPVADATSLAPSLLEYPVDFPIKVMGRSADGFTEAIIALVLEHAPNFDPSTIETRPSNQGNYVGLTATINATSREQLDALYRALTSHPMVKVVL